MPAVNDLSKLNICFSRPISVARSKLSHSVPMQNEDQKYVFSPGRVVWSGTLPADDLINLWVVINNFRLQQYSLSGVPNTLSASSELQNHSDVC